MAITKATNTELRFDIRGVKYALRSITHYVLIAVSGKPQPRVAACFVWCGFSAFEQAS
jgi:hypothetical protein